MPVTVVDALRMPYPCVCDCHNVLTLAERVQGVEALYRYDDAMRGWGYTVVWDLGATVLWKVAQEMNSADYKWITVRDTGCVYSRLVGYCVHELIHAVNGDVTKANYGIPFGLPYRVPLDVSPTDEVEYLRPFNEVEARAWTGIGLVAHHLFGIEWPIRNARDVGTYGFVGGNAMLDDLDGYRSVPHYDSAHHQNRYYSLARRLEDEQRAWFTAARLDEIAARFTAAEAIGRERRTVAFPPAKELAKLPAKMPGRNDLCPCGSTQKYKKCHGAVVGEP